MPTPLVLTRTGRARRRATALGGGLAVLLAGSLASHLPVAGTAARDAAAHTAVSGLSSVTGTLGAVARTGGLR